MAAQAVNGATRVVVIDDDPTGTQASAGVPILLDPYRDPAPLLAADTALHILTNTRALDRPAAVELVSGIRERVDRVAAAHGWPVEYVLRGDTTLRGHVLAEADALGAAGSVLLFVPAYPQIGRRTVDGVHRVDVSGATVNVADTEFAADPVFGYRARSMAEWVAEHARSAGAAPRRVHLVGLAELRSGGLDRSLREAGPGSVVVPDVAEPRDLELVSAAIGRARSAGARLVVRGSAALAALRTGRMARGYVELAPDPAGPAVLVVCGSHTAAAGAQLAELARAGGAPVHTLPLPEPEGVAQAVDRAAKACVEDLRTNGLAILATARHRRPEHASLDYGQKVMVVLQAAVSAVVSAWPGLGTVIAKGGITSAETARVGLGAVSAVVRGPLQPGVAVWNVVGPAASPLTYVVVPGNVGANDTLVRVAAAAGVSIGGVPA